MHITDTVSNLVHSRVTQDLSVSPAYDAIFWNPPEKYKFKNKSPPKPKAVKVYEAHGEHFSILLLGAPLPMCTDGPLMRFKSAFPPLSQKSQRTKSLQRTTYQESRSWDIILFK